MTRLEFACHAPDFPPTRSSALTRPRGMAIIALCYLYQMNHQVIHKQKFIYSACREIVRILLLASVAISQRAT